ncbi:hypothetical protein HYZ64_01075 [Candidatus Berkelbacteria bacterium]|nr:hypothetical protein [Candidatus Berkelbacteria bacterium]
MQELQQLAKSLYGEHAELVKAVIDVERCIMAIGGEMHSDEEAMLLEDGSKQQYLWGINIYPNKLKTEWIEFDSMINLRPSQHNRTRGVENLALREQITAIVGKLVEP